MSKWLIVLRIPTVILSGGDRYDLRGFSMLVFQRSIKSGSELPDFSVRF